MLRRLRIGLALAVLAAALWTLSAAGSARPPASARVIACSLEQHAATFVGRMRQVTDSERMWMRFRLLEKGSTGFNVRKAPGLGRWRKSKPGVGAFAYRQTVRGLEAGSVYRAQVDFRWYDDAGALVLTARRRSAPCRQFAGLPNLTATPRSGAPGVKPGVLRYSVLVTNEGSAPATGVPVRLAVDGATVDTVVVPALLPAQRRLLKIHGPACTTSVEAAADPDGVIVESSEADNAHAVDCADLPSP